MSVHSKNQPITDICLNVTEECNMNCTYCLMPGTKILLANGQLVNIEDIKIGDEVLGFNEAKEKNKYRKVYPVKVLQLHQHSVKEILKITMSDGKHLYITENHKVLNGRNKWTETKNLRRKTGHVMSLGYLPVDTDKPDIFNENYIKGYFTAMWLTNGSFNHYQMRLAVKDDEIIERMKKYCNILDFPYTIRDFKISEEENLWKPAIFSSQQANYIFIQQLCSQIQENNNNKDYIKGFIAACYDAEGHIDKVSRVLSISNTDPFILDMWEKGLQSFGFIVKRDKLSKGVNKPVYRSRLVTQFHKPGEEQIRFFNLFQPAVKRKREQVFVNSCPFYRNNIQNIEKLKGDFTVYNIGTESHTYIANGLAVHNCFTEHHPHFMTLQVAKDAATWLHNNALQCETKEVPMIGFFGGEPTLMWDSIIVPLVNFIEEQGWEFNFGITSNCALMNKEKVDFLVKHNIGLLLSMDGAKTSQNLNRPLKNSNKNSFDEVDKNLDYIVQHFPLTTFRSTITPTTAPYLFENLMYAANKGFQNVFAIINEFEEWTSESREIIERELDKYCFYVIDACRRGERFVRLRPFEQAINKIVCINQMSLLDKEDQDIGPEPLQRCGLGSGYGSINYKGDVFACQEVASRKGEKDIFYIGNIYDGIDEDKLNNLQSSFLNRSIKKYNYENPNKCQTCKIQQVCEANLCHVNNYILYQDFSALPDCWCWWNNMLIEKAQFVMQVLGYHKNEYFKNYLINELKMQGGPFHYGNPK